METKRSRETLESSFTQKLSISKMSIEPKEQIKDEMANELVTKKNLMEARQLNDQELNNGIEGTKEVFEI